MTNLNTQINNKKEHIMQEARKLTELYVERDNADGFLRMAQFMLAGVMATLHPFMGQRMAYEAVLALLDEMGTKTLPEEFQTMGIQKDMK
jgi:ribosomal protein RSM22 (predicted rRNA methylase)